MREAAPVWGRGAEWRTRHVSCLRLAPAESAARRRVCGRRRKGSPAPPRLC